MMLGPLVLASACVVIEHERIVLADLAAAVPAFSAAPPDEAIGLAPTPGVRRIFGRVELERLAARYGVTVPSGAGACFERATGLLAEAHVIEALGRAFHGEKGGWTLVDFSRYPVPRGEIEFTAPSPTVTKAPVLVRGRIRYAENRSTPIWARVKVTRPPREVEPGDTVAVEVASGAALLKFEARAESGGGLGETVVLRNPATKTCFSGRVAAQRKVTLNATQSSPKQVPDGAAPDSLRGPGR